MLYTDSYQTTVGAAFVTKSVETAIKQAIIKDSIDRMSLRVKSEGEFQPVFITGAYPSESDIPLFTHPISIMSLDHRKFLCTDLRLYVKKDIDIEHVEAGIRNLTEFNFVKSRAILNLLWINGESAMIKNSLLFGTSVFSHWLTDTIVRAYALDFKDQSTINVLCAFYYLTLFDNEHMNKEYKEKLAVHTIKATKVPAEFVFSVLDKVEQMNSINDLIQAIIDITENSRLNQFNLAVLLTLIKNSWYGTQVKEILAVCLEHPPTWLAIVYASLSERTYKNSMIFKIAERLGKKGLADEFMANYRNLIEDHLTPARESIDILAFE